MHNRLFLFRCLLWLIAFIIAGMFIGLVICMVIFGPVALVRWHSYDTDTTAIVINVDKDQVWDHKGYGYHYEYIYTYRYETPSGTFTGKTLPKRKHYEEGDELSIKYSSKEPEKSTLSNSITTNVMVTVFDVIFVAFWISFFIPTKKDKSEKEAIGEL